MRRQEALDGALRDLPSAQLVSVAYADLASGEVASFRADELVHAASTMKLAVLMEAERQAARGELDLRRCLRVENRFESLVGGAAFAVDAGSDEDAELHARIGQEATLDDLLERMTVRSSNLATNLVLRSVSPASVTALCERLGATRTRVLRGVEDALAHAAGQDNLITAHDLVRLLAALGTRAVEGAEAAVGRLLRQEFNEGIPAALPAGMVAAHKTGAITGHCHDAALIYRGPERLPAALAVMTRGFAREADALAWIHRAVRALTE